jgi:hypothetical protein
LRKKYIIFAVIVLVTLWGVYSVSNQTPTSNTNTISPISSTQIPEACPKSDDPRMNWDWTTKNTVRLTNSGYEMIINITFTNNLGRQFAINEVRLTLVNVTLPNGTVVTKNLSKTTSVNRLFAVGQTESLISEIQTERVIAANAVVELDVPACPPIIFPVNFHQVQ